MTTNCDYNPRHRLGQRILKHRCSLEHSSTTHSAVANSWKRDNAQINEQKNTVAILDTETREDDTDDCPPLIADDDIQDCMFLPLDEDDWIVLSNSEIQQIPKHTFASPARNFFGFMYRQ